MLLYLTELLSRNVRTFNVFSYITLRAVLACMTALVISFVIGPRMIAWLTRMKIGQAVRDDGPQTHLAKAGTPTMGGALILVSIAITTLLWGDLDNRFVWVVLQISTWIDDISTGHNFLWPLIGSSGIVRFIADLIPILTHLV